MLPHQQLHHDRQPANNPPPPHQSSMLKELSKTQLSPADYVDRHGTRALFGDYLEYLAADIRACEAILRTDITAYERRTVHERVRSAEARKSQRKAFEKAKKQAHVRSDTDGFPVCAKHASRKHVLALKIYAVFEQWDSKGMVEAAPSANPNNLRKASGYIARNALNNGRSRRPGFFYLFECVDMNPHVLKFGVDFCEFDDDVEGRISTHESSSCDPDINHYAVSKHFPDASLFDHVVNMLLALAKVNVQCPCGQTNHKEYFELGQFAVQMGTGLWKLFRDIVPFTQAV
ncbi:hypothetical protein HDU87_000612 [Geranomyces variabilis]|uniref:Bacteriophage T5 Orf172 DNA-binding domain-containing protein n=1 Tax=Geranomyces variabilis TaxID=109894 RepID=A0AAD5TDQ1_9FUNG|nr:hypothetical protein HDU87_000612 [Geranomyces variabilis]